jgi:peptidoglycan/LPS O-acetylase OafA/YrhL
MLLAAMMAVILLSRRDVLLAKIFESAPLRLLGKYSYGMYVIQLPLVTLLPMSALATHLPNSPLFAATIYVVTIFAAILSIAILSYHLFESHFLRLKKVFP